MGLAFARAVLLAAINAPAPSAAHGPIEEGIHRLDAQVEASPGNAARFLERANLHWVEGDLAAARADLLRAEELGAPAAELHLARARVALAGGEAREALEEADAALAAGLDRVDLHPLRAEALLALGRDAEAAQAYGDAMALQPRPSPDYVLARARVLARLDPETALRALDEAREALGTLVALELYATELEEGLGAYQAALARVERLAASGGRQDPWLERRGALLERAGDRSGAVAAYRSAQVALEHVPAARRATPESEARRVRLARALARLEGEVR
jgi:tetratricopeptide (TPR) repeat protein